MTTYHIRRVDWQQYGETCANLRKLVFFEEARYHYFAALDGADIRCRHVLAVDAQQQPIGCGRIDQDWRLSRIAVLRAWRQLGVGTALLNELIAIARDSGAAQVQCAVPVFSVEYYRQQQFEPTGSVYQESSVPHQRMQLQLVSVGARNAVGGE